MKSSKNYCSTVVGLTLLSLAAMKFTGCAATRPIHDVAGQGHALVNETPFEFIASGDLDGDGRLDIVVADKVTGRYRIGYQLKAGELQWVSVRNAGIPKTTGFTAGRLLDEKRDAFAFTSPDAATINVIDASDPTRPKPPLEYAPASLGPLSIVAVDIGGDGNTPLADLVAGTIYNAPEPNRIDLLRNTGTEAEYINDLELDGELQRLSRVDVKSAGEVIAGFVKVDQAKSLRFARIVDGEPDVIAELSGLGVDADYVVGRFRDAGAGTVLIYEPGKAGVRIFELKETASGGLEASEEVQFAFEEPVRQIFVFGRAGTSRMVVTFGEGEKAGVFDMVKEASPKLVQMLERPTAEYWSGMAGLGDGFVGLLRRPTVKFSSRYQLFSPEESGYVCSAPSELTTLDENDLKIHALIIERLQVTKESDMKVYTNTIPGTKVNYTMVPIQGGQFVMGSPETEPERKEDEGPQHKVSVEAFWMGKHEVTWDEFELFMYSDEERKFRDTIQTDPAIDKISDAVSRPTRPYVEMSFGMGRYGYPAIAMTQHGANKYCQWLSAKTGHFYRLPTEAEWEYACRAGTTTAYFFGDDPAQLGQYGWFEDNGDFKYQKVGRKKPNPWGLHDMHGNVWEWCLDQYLPDFSMWKEPVVVSPWNRATMPYPHVARGGSYDDIASRLRSAARKPSTRLWKMQDPQLPKSVWWLSDAPWVGFRLVRPLKVPSADDLTKYWTSGVERD